MKVSQVLIFAIFALISLSSVTAGKNVVCYFASWTVYRDGNGKFDVSNIDQSLCTHIMFGFIGLGGDYKVKILDSWESNDDYGPKGFEHLIGLKQSKPELKVMVSMGGWNEGSDRYSQMAADPIKRQVFIKSVLNFTQAYGFDGFDLDWEYPGLRDSAYPQLDKADYAMLLNELKSALHPLGLLLSAAVSGGVANADVAYDFPAVSEALDMINVMVYDFHGAFDNYVGHVAPLYASSLDDTDDKKQLNADAGIQNWLDKGADPAKINFGIVTYGRSFTLADANNTQLYAPIKGGGRAGPYTGQDGVLGYNESRRGTKICELHSDWTYYWDDEQKVPHRISGDQWVGYDDVNSIQLKAEYVVSKNLAGMMVWAFDTDDFLGICGSENYPLLRTINRVLN
ncbi:hypothetical protein NQ318_000963 [Aromia moschata]|uniref:GH18 domain-containing protein n=1 Tax=Aromia moschata TaxID=1265417 RepID=A0AAV8ZF32_9CUCU|nr:hypothetical protein NQ318_000963 [Aromia moschata]